MLRIVPFALAALAVAVALRLSPGPTQEGAHAEAARIERRLERIEARVLRDDAELRRLNQALGAELLDAMEAAHPGISDEVGRVPTLLARAAEARERGDAAAAAESLAEARRIEARVDAARSSALGLPGLASMVDAFNALLRERMIRAEPEAERLLTRYAELHEGIAAAAEP